MSQIRYAIGADEEGDHTFLVIDFDRQVLAIVQENDDGEPPDIVAIPPKAVALMMSLLVPHMDPDSYQLNTEKMSVN